MENEDNPIDGGLRVAILGPLLTYTHQAAENHYQKREDVTDGIRITPYRTIDDVFAAVEAGKMDEGVVPEENVIEGTVRATMDGYHNRKVYLVAKEVIPVNHYVGTSPDADVQDIEEILSKTEAFSQCSQWIGAYLPNATQTPANSTADAARIVKEEGSPKKAAIAPEMALNELGLSVIASNVGNVAYNKTMFGIIKGGLLKPALMPEPTGDDETTIIIHPNQDYSGQLEGYLRPFSSRGINLTRIESRPGIVSRTPSDARGDRMGYLLNLSLRGHLKDEGVKDALTDLLTNTALYEGTAVKMIGSHPRVELYGNGR